MEGENYAIRGVTNSSTGYSGFFQGGRFHISGNTGIGVTNPTAKLVVAGQVKITGGSPGTGKVLTSDAAGLASWQTPSGGLILPYSGTISLSDPTFTLRNTGTGNGIDIRVTSGRGIYSRTLSSLGVAIYGVSEYTGSGGSWGVYGESNSIGGEGIQGNARAEAGLNYGVNGRTASTGGVGVQGIAEATTGTTIGVRGWVNSVDGYSGYFTGGRFYVNGNVGVKNSNPANALSVAGQADISERLVVGGTTLAGRLLVANADGAGKSGSYFSSTNTTE